MLRVEGAVLQSNIEWIRLNCILVRYYHTILLDNGRFAPIAYCLCKGGAIKRHIKPSHNMGYFACIIRLRNGCTNLDIDTLLLTLLLAVSFRYTSEETTNQHILARNNVYIDDTSKHIRRKTISDFTERILS